MNLTLKKLYDAARKFGNVFRFIDDLIAINDGNEFENHYNEIYPSELILKKENTSHRETTSLYKQESNPNILI